MQVAVLGESERAMCHRAWYERQGAGLLPPVPAGAAAAVPPADLYDLCDEGAGAARLLADVLRRRRSHVLVSGPFPTDAGQALRLARAAARHRSAVAVTGGWRWVPGFARLREVVAGGTLGSVRRVDVRVCAAAERTAEVRLGALDLGLWLAGDGTPAAADASPAAVRFRAGGAEILVEWTGDALSREPTWTVILEADLGQAAAQATFTPGLPGQPCRAQTASITRAGRRRDLILPDADPAAGELAALLTRQDAGLPWLGLCLAERAATLAALLAVPAAELAAKPPPAG